MAFSVSTSWAMAIALAAVDATKRSSSSWATVTLVPCEKLPLQVTSISGCAAAARVSLVVVPAAMVTTLARPARA